MNYRSTLAAGILALAALGLAGLPAAQGAENASTQAAAAVKYRVVFQVSDADPKKWNLALSNIKNVQEDLGRSNVEVELVAYGPGLGMLKFDSEVADRVAESVDRGVRTVACENTMRSLKLTADDMLPRIQFVKAGVVEIMSKQAQGYQYIRP
jgi:uncharacterized protein